MSTNVILSIFHHKTGCALNKQIYEIFQEFNYIEKKANPVIREYFKRFR